MQFKCYLRGDTDLDRERAGLRIGERLRRRGGGDRLGGLLARLSGDLKRKASASGAIHFHNLKYDF